MAPTTDIRDCQKFAAAVSVAGGEVPRLLQRLPLASHEVLRAPGRSQPPESAIMDAVLAGDLTAPKLDKLLPGAATAAMIATYRQGLARESEHILVGAWHRAMEDGAADEIIASMCDRFDKHAAAIAAARSLFTAESTPEYVLASAEPRAIEAWQQLDGHIRAVTKIAAVASQFGCRPQAQFPQVKEFNLGENFNIDDRAVMCTTGGLVADSALFGRPDQGHRSSPFFRVGGLRLHSVREAQIRYDGWAAEEFDRVHSGPRGGWVDETGKVHEHPVPPNPFRSQAVST